MGDVEVMQVIRTQLLRRGKGTPESPIRIITQYWSMDGELLVEVDPFPASQHSSPPGAPTT
jgi:hypothetical protein